MNPGDRILLMLSNQVELWDVMLAAIKLGAVVIPATTLLAEGDIADRIAGRWGRTELTEPGQSLTLALEERATGRLVGDAVLFWHSAEHRAGEVGYILSPEATGLGYATEAATAMLRLGFDGLGLHRMVARLDERNTASARVAERLGMRLEARLVQNEWFKGEWSTELVFAMLEDEWRASPLR